MCDIATKPIAIVRALALVMFPAAVHSRYGGGAFEQQWRIATWGTLLIALTGSVLAVLLRDQLIALVLGARYVASADVFGVIVGDRKSTRLNSSHG